MTSYEFVFVIILPGLKFLLQILRRWTKKKQHHKTTHNNVVWEFLNRIDVHIEFTMKMYTNILDGF